MTDTDYPKVSVDNLICSCKPAGQIMERKRLGGFFCPNCGQEAELVLRWGKSVNDDPPNTLEPERGYRADSRQRRFAKWLLGLLDYR